MKSVRVLLALALLLPLALNTSADDEKGALQARLVDDLTNLFSDSLVADTPAFEGPLDTPRGSFAGVNVLVNGVAKGDALAFAQTCDGQPLQTCWYRLRDVPVDANTGVRAWTEKMDGKTNPDVIRRAPFHEFDAIEPVSSPVKTLGDVSVLRFEVAVPADAKPGKRTYELSVSAAGNSVKLAFELVVHAVVVPPVGRDSFVFTNWCNFANIARFHKVESWSEAHWKLIEQYARLMGRSRQNSILLPCGNLFEGKDFTLNVERLERLVKIFSNAGIYWLEGGHLGGRTGGLWDSETFDVHGGIRATGEAGNRQLAHLCGQLMQVIKRNGWQDRWLQHVADEPTPTNASDYRILVGMTRKYMPGIPIVDAVMDTELAGSVDIWCPKANEYQLAREAFDASRQQGDRIWVYTCLEPGGNWMNRLLDMELLRPLLIGWVCERFGLDGFLHWGLNWCVQDPFEVGNQPHGNAGDKSRLPAGDDHVVYPAPDGVWSSTRLEAQRAGFEDLELLRLLKAKNPKLEQALLDRVARAFNDYTKDIKVYRQARRELLQAL